MRLVVTERPKQEPKLVPISEVPEGRWCVIWRASGSRADLVGQIGMRREEIVRFIPYSTIRDCALTTSGALKDCLCEVLPLDFVPVNVNGRLEVPPAEEKPIPLSECESDWAVVSIALGYYDQGDILEKRNDRNWYKLKDISPASKTVLGEILVYPITPGTTGKWDDERKEQGQ